MFVNTRNCAPDAFEVVVREINYHNDLPRLLTALRHLGGEVTLVVNTAAVDAYAIRFLAGVTEAQVQDIVHYCNLGHEDYLNAL